MTNDRFTPSRDYFNPGATRDPKTGEFPVIELRDSTDALIAVASIQAGHHWSCSPPVEFPTIGQYQGVEMEISSRHNNFSLDALEETMVAIHGADNIFSPTLRTVRSFIWGKINLEDLRRVLNGYAGFIENSRISRPARMTEIMDRLGVSPETNPRAFADLVTYALSKASSDAHPITSLQARMAVECPDAPLFSKRDLCAEIFRRVARAYVADHAPEAAPAMPMAAPTM